MAEDGRRVVRRFGQEREGVILGIDFGGSKIAAALAELDGTLGEVRTAPTDPRAGASANLERALGLARQLLGDSGDDATAAREIISVGACTFGIPLADGVQLSPAIPGWDRLPLRARLEQAFGVPVALVTDVKAAAMAEASTG